MSSDIEIYKSFLGILERSAFINACLKNAMLLDLPNWWLVGGAVRDTVWSNLAGRPFAVAPKDIDLIYFDRSLTSKNIDKSLETYLGKVSGVDWSVKNQARMHDFEKIDAYNSIEEAVSYFPETISGVLIKMSNSGKLLTVNMYGLRDLFGMQFRPTPNYLERHSLSSFQERVMKKGWLDKWPEARIAS